MRGIALKKAQLECAEKALFDDFLRSTVPRLVSAPRLE
jgi:hypothetical protein